MSKPTEQTAVMASSLSSVSTPASAAAIHTLVFGNGNKRAAQTADCAGSHHAAFFTASFSNAKAAVVPCVPQTLKPISSRMRATESPTAGVGANDKSRIPNGIFNIFEASRPMSSPTRVILKAVFFTTSATSVNVVASEFSNAAFTTPGPDTPTLIMASASPEP